MFFYLRSRLIPILLATVVGVALVLSVRVPRSTAQQPPASPPPDWFKGKIGKTRQDSTPSWPPVAQAPKGAPNIVMVVLDDVGFAQLGCYGGPIETPNLDRLARNGLRYVNFNVTALCSPTRAALLTGRNHHANGMGTITRIATGFPGYHARMPFENATLAETLQVNGYNTFAIGKWHLVPVEEATQAGPFDRWPLGRGFERFYGFLHAETNQWHPELWEDNRPVDPPRKSNYHLTEDLVDKSIEYLRSQQAAAPDNPFFLYLAPGAAHAPHHAPREWIEKYRGRFDQGWDKVREEVLHRQKQMGIAPPHTVLPPRNPGVKDWDELSADEKRLFARMQEVFAGFLAHADHHIGRLINFLEETGEFENTFIIVVSDNGASQEGGPLGSVNEMRFFNGVPDRLADNLKAIDQLGSERTHNHYPIGWAMAGNTPFRWWKQNASHFGGTRVPFILHWPARIKDQGGIRAQFHHAIDVVPTALELIGLQPPAVYKGYRQNPIEGVSMSYSLAQATAPTNHRLQYFEMMGHRAIIKDGWKAGAWHRRGTDFAQDQWELYHIEEDWNETRDLAAQHPEKLKELQSAWWAEATMRHVLPLDDRTVERLLEPRPRVSGERATFTYYPGVSRVPNDAAPNVRSRSYTIKAEVEIPVQGAEGVLLAQGGHPSGCSFFVQNQRLVFVYNFLDIERFTITASEPLPAGRATLSFEFTRAGNNPGAGGTGVLLINGRKVGEGQIARTMPFLVGFEGLDVGQDSLTSVAESYRSPYAFTGKLYKVEVQLK